MKLVEDDETYAFEGGVGLQGADQNALGHHFDPRAGSDLRIEPRAISDSLAHTLAKHGRHPACGRAGGEPPRLQHDNAPMLQPGCAEQRQRHQGGFAGAGRRLQHCGAVVGQCGGDARQGFRDRQPRLPESEIDKLHAPAP